MVTRAVVEVDLVPLVVKVARPSGNLVELVGVLSATSNWFRFGVAVPVAEGRRERLTPILRCPIQEEAGALSRS